MDNLIDDVRNCKKPVTTSGILQNYLGVAMIEGILDDGSQFDSEKTAEAVSEILLDHQTSGLTKEKIIDELIKVRDDVAPCACGDCQDNDPHSKEVYGNA
jgi:hypothetical protein